MSWQSYVDDHLMGAELANGGTLTAAAIFGQDGNVWAQSPEFPACTVEQMKVICDSFNTENFSSLMGKAMLDKQKYMVVPGESGAVLRGKLDKGGICIKKTNSAVVIGIYGDGVQPGDVNVIVENLGDYLINQGI